MFANKGLNIRIEFYHAPIAGRLKGVFGAQYQTQKSSAIRLMEDRDVEKNLFALVPNTDKRAAFSPLSSSNSAASLSKPAHAGSASALPCITTAQRWKTSSNAVKAASAAACAPI